MKRNWSEQLQRKIADFDKACASGDKSVGAQRAWLEGYLQGLMLAGVLDVGGYGVYLAGLANIEEQAQQQRKVG